MGPSNSICRRENSFLSIHLQKFRRIVPLFLCYELMHFSVKYLFLHYSLFVFSLFYFAILFDRKIVHSKFLCFRFSEDFRLVDRLVWNIFHEEYVVISSAVYVEIILLWNSWNLDFVSLWFYEDLKMVN